MYMLLLLLSPLVTDIRERLQRSASLAVGLAATASGSASACCLNL